MRFADLDDDFYASDRILVGNDSKATLKLICRENIVVLRFAHQGLLSRYAELVSRGTVPVARNIFLPKLKRENYDAALLLGEKTSVMIEVKTVDDALLDRFFGVESISIHLDYPTSRKNIDAVTRYYRKKFLECTGLPPEVNVVWMKRPTELFWWGFSRDKHVKEFKEWLEVMWALSKVLPIKELRLKIMGMARPLQSRAAFKKLMEA